ncbi:MAG TPA: hypothetical protein VFB74_09645 [Kribbellaceae bacterium]|nr:hypothetical protein [Kribbellaceae bacterium]
MTCHHPPPSPFERTWDCRCPTHAGRHRFTYNDPGCHCRIICASQPPTLLVARAAVFVNYHGDLWSVPALAADRFDWWHAAPVNRHVPGRIGHRAPTARRSSPTRQHLP